MTYRTKGNDMVIIYRLSNEELKQAVVDYLSNRVQEAPPEGWQRNHIYFTVATSGSEVTVHAEAERPTE